MDPQTKRTLAATALCLLLLFVWIKLSPPPTPPSTPPAVATLDAADGGTDAARPAPSTAPTGDAPTMTAAQPSAELVAIGGDSSETLTLGDDRQDNRRANFTNPYAFAVTISPVGASVESVRLSQHRSHVAKNHREPDHAPYELLRPVADPHANAILRSFTTDRLRLVDEKKEIALADLTWRAEKSVDADGETASLVATIRDGDANLFRVTKSFRVEKGSPHLKINYQLENLSPRPQKIRLTEGGPLGFMKEDLRYDNVRVIAALIYEDGRIKLGDQAIKKDVVNHRRDFVPAETSRFLWSAVSNKYYTCLVAPRPQAGAKTAYAPYLDQLFARTTLDNKLYEADLSFAQVYAPGESIAPGGRVELSVEAYCGPKSDRVFDSITEAAARRYSLVMSPDRSSCTFDVINTAMLWLLSVIYGLLRNYGIAIIILVIIVRILLHPVSKKGQINMMRMQKNMSRIKPKLEAIQEQYKNDRQKLNEETMKLYRDEGVNPAASMLGCLPLFLQMPIWIALYTTLNTNVDLRHAPFFGYIRDLSSPDALIPFGAAYEIPLISFLMGGAITAINLLPIIMTVLMYGQQKLTQKLTKPDKPPEPKLDKDGRPLPDTMAQQQKMMSFMMIFMGFIFYNMPSGLCLYILCSSLFGMAEQWYIRKHVKDQEARGAFEPVAAGVPKKKGWLQTKMEHWQKLAQQQGRDRAPTAKRKKSRF